MSPKSLVKTAFKKRIDVLAVTDHDTLKGAFETVKTAKNSNMGIIVIPGVEISTNLGHVIGLFLQENIASKNFADVVSEIKRQNGLLMIPHPFKSSQKMGIEEIAKADLLEALNGRATAKENRLAINLGKRLNKPLVAGSDAHFSFELGRVLTLLPQKPNDLDELRTMLVNGFIVGIKGNNDSFAPRFAHALSFSIETCRRIAVFQK